MDPISISALATSVIAFVTIIGVMVGIYYNLITTGMKPTYIFIFEILFVLAVGLFTSWVRGGIEE